MKILYGALRHDPTNPDLASGVDYNFYSAFVREGAEVRVVGPFPQPGWLIDRALNRFYRAFVRKRYLKWNLQITRLSAMALNKAEGEWHPDIVFSLFPPPLAFYHGQAPCVFNTDTTLQGMQENGVDFGRLPLAFLIWQERRAVRKSALTITFSEWCKNKLVASHQIGPERLFVQPMPSALPPEAVPTRDEFVPKKMGNPIRLLLVGRDYKRKGIPIAIEVAKQLNERGIPAELTICGLTGEPDGPVRYAGLFRKSVPEELGRYADLYRRAHLLIHPALFEAAGIVPAEAAAFGAPTITNDVGGLATSVAHGVSGIVLPGHSPAEAYVETIVRLVQKPDEYARLSKGARKRYEEEQNWQVAGRQVMKRLEEAAASRRN
jgi:glycosyltransferase involved in cell wall biosynthesis